MESDDSKAGAKEGFFVSVDYSKNALREIDAFFRKSGRIVIPLNARDSERADCDEACMTIADPAIWQISQTGR